MAVLIIIPVDTRSCVKAPPKKKRKRKSVNAVQTLQFPFNIITLF